MRALSFPSAIVLSLAALAAACASPEGGAPRVTPATGPTAAGAPADVLDVPGTLWGDPTGAEAAELRAFLDADTGDDATDGLTRTVSNTTPVPAPTGHEVRALRLRNGQLLAGTLVADDGSSVEFAFETAEGVRGTTRVAYADIHPESVAELMLTRADEGDSGALIDIAEYAAAEGLYEIARIHYLAAADRDPAVRSIAEQRLQALADEVANAELTRGRGAVAAGDDGVARRILRRVQREFAGTPAADRAAAEIAAIDERAAERKLDAAREKRLEPIRGLLAEAGKMTDAGLRRAHEPSQAIRSYMGARSKADAARKRLPAARSAGEKSDDAELLGALDDLAARLDEQDVDNETHLATAYLDKGDFTRARQAANSVLVIDPRNREALSLLTQIRAAEEERRSETYDVWWYRYRRHRGVYPYPYRWYPQRGVGWGSIRRGGVPAGGGSRPPIGVFRR